MHLVCFSPSGNGAAQTSVGLDADWSGGSERKGNSGFWVFFTKLKIHVQEAGSGHGLGSHVEWHAAGLWKGKRSPCWCILVPGWVKHTKSLQETLQSSPSWRGLGPAWREGIAQAKPLQMAWEISFSYGQGPNSLPIFRMLAVKRNKRNKLP